MSKKPPKKKGKSARRESATQKTNQPKQEKSEQAKMSLTKTIASKGAIGAVLLVVFDFIGRVVTGLDFLQYLFEWRTHLLNFIVLGGVVGGVLFIYAYWQFFHQRPLYRYFAIIVLLAIASAGMAGWNSYVKARKAKLIVLIANFDGPEEVFGLRNEIYEKLGSTFVNDPDVVIETVNETIQPTSESGSSRAKKVGKQYQADVVIWGWYLPNKAPNITIHFENLSPDQIQMLQHSETYQPQATLADLESFEIQQKIGEETGTLISYIQGEISLQSYQYQESLNRFEAILLETNMSAYIDPALLYFKIGSAYLHLDKHSTAIEYLDKSLGLNPDFTEGYNNRAAAYILLQEYERANQDLDTALRLDPNNLITYDLRGLANYLQENYTLAIEEYQKALQIEPNRATIHDNIGLVYDEIENYDLALNYLSQAIALDPAFSLAYAHRGLTYRHLGRNDLSIRDYNEAIKLDPNSALAYSNRGVVYFELGDLDQALQDFDKAIELQPDLAEGYNNRAGVYVYREEYQRALEDMDKVIQLVPYKADAYVNRGLAYISMQKYELALIELNKAIELDPNYAKAYYNRAVTYQYLGRASDAAVDFAKVKELTGEDAPRD